MRTVHKFRVAVADLVQLSLPRGSKVVAAADYPQAAQHLDLWVELDTASPPVIRNLRVYGTGHEIAKDDIYVATIKQGPFVWHLYDGGEEILPIGMGRPTLAPTKPRRPLGAK